MVTSTTPAGCRSSPNEVIEATKIYVRHRDLFDDAMTRFMAERLLRADLKTMTLSVTADDSRKINDQVGAPACAMPGETLTSGKP
jgi:hypothetical protein